jgi:hypothetical protein
VHSLFQQLIRQDPLYWLFTIYFQEEKNWKLVFYPFPCENYGADDSGDLIIEGRSVPDLGIPLSKVILNDEFLLGKIYVRLGAFFCKDNHERLLVTPTGLDYVAIWPVYAGFKENGIQLEDNLGTFNHAANRHRELNPPDVQFVDNLSRLPFEPFPAAVQLTGLGPISDALVGRVHWTST